MEESEPLQTSETAQDSPDDVDSKDKINQRREARRRRILLNAQQRLNVLSGRGEDPLEIDHSPSLHNIDDEPDVLAGYVPQPPPPMLPTYKQEDLNEFFNGLKASPKPQRHYFLRYRLHVVLVALLSFTIALIANRHFGIYIPVGICIVLELFYFREQQPLSPIVSILLTLSGLKAQKVTAVFQLVTTLQHLFADLCLSTFIFIALSLLLTHINDGFAELITFT